VSGSGSVPSASRAESRCARGRGVSLAGHSIRSSRHKHRQSRSEIGECNGDSNMGASYNKREL
jgi:hypothetical protein